MNTIYAPLTIEDILELLPGVSERALRSTVRRLGCCSLIGGKMYFELSDFKQLLEGTKLCRSNSSGGEESPTSTVPLTVNAFDEALRLATQKSQPLVERKKKRVSTERQSTESKMKRHSLTLVSNI
jgi:hypothetical protein